MEEAPQAEPVEFAASPVKGDIWPQPRGADMMLALGAGYIVFGVGGLLGSSFPILRPVLIPIGVALAGVWLAHLFGNIRGLLYVGGWSGERAERAQNVRLRVVRPSKSLKFAIEATEDAAFEPVVWRSVSAVQLGDMDRETGLPRGQPGRRGRPSSTAETQGGGTVGIAELLVFAFSIVAVSAVTRAATGSWHDAIRQESFWAVMALTVVLSAFVRPVYLRVAPGVLDIFVYPALGLGRPRSARFDLRRARVTIDQRAGWIAIVDPSRATVPVLFVRQRRLIGARHMGAHVLAAARTSAATPPLPMDELSG